MRVLVIGHPEAVLGFSLAGVDGRVATTAAEINSALDDALAAREVGVVLVTREAARLVQPRMDELTLHSTLPLIVEIPSPQAAEADEPSLSDVVLRAIGIKL